MFQPCPRVGCSTCEESWCVCPQVWGGMAGEGTIRNIHQGDAVSAIAKSELQEGCLECCHVHTSEWSLWSLSSQPAELLVWRGCAGVGDHLHGWMRQDECVRVKFLHLWLHFCMLITKLQTSSAAYRVYLGGASQSLAWQSLCTVWH